MTKVEDYANWSVNDMFHELICYCGGRDFQDDASKALKAAILAKAHAEGVAEGAEQEAAKIVHCRDCKRARPMPSIFTRRCSVWFCVVLADGFCYGGDRKPASVLAPTKEGEK